MFEGLHPIPLGLWSIEWIQSLHISACYTDQHNGVGGWRVPEWVSFRPHDRVSALID